MNTALLEEILSQPSAPFREGHVINLVKRLLAAANVPHFSDPVGNIVIGVSSRAAYMRAMRSSSSATRRDPLRVFVAHMDHPGFHGVKWRSPTRLEIVWHGGSPTQHLEGAKVWLAWREGWLSEGRLREPKLDSTGRYMVSAVVELDSELSPAAAKDAKGLFGGLAFRAPHWREGEILYTKAADDLVGTFAVVSLALDLMSRAKPNSRIPKDPPFIGLLTRGEEVGYIGAIGHLELGWHKSAKRPLLYVSLETSRTLPGAEIGKGPVVRLGDRSTVFDSSALMVFTELARKTLPGAHQRRVMDGGTCEGTVATAYGIPCVGISVPLGNYHNQSFEGGPDSAGPMGPAPEFVHMGDVAGLIKLCHALLGRKLPWQAPWQRKIAEFRKELRFYRPLLKRID